MRVPVVVLAMALGVPACGSAPAADPGSAELYLYSGSRQCERGGKSPEEVMRDLAAAGIRVESARCGHDGRMYAQSCGGPDGRIVVVRVAHSQAEKAARLGFKPLRELPDASTATCR